MDLFRAIHEVVFAVLLVVAVGLGVIGAGGIGHVLFETIRGFYYPQASAILIIVVATVTVMDLVSQSLRKRVI
ncbi:PhnE/PtxC family ABC transporter permease [Antarcticirhabdus aurantiaca]|uniref:Uncharacterized protein n=1 Tax=Antarcticirhabdus aurantiaca TaxID=2606717 RepID=A0ACD4NH32_9HYPH|nr:hypothetical protein [Antarcticirhabdus aurantiaca]WAJ26118.1 hypothetical protein OXU80_14455 [Jeongeuplla avenae]